MRRSLRVRESVAIEAYQSNSNALHTDELVSLPRIALHLKAQLNSLAHTHHQLVQRTGLGMASRKFGDAGNVVTLRVSLDDYVEFAFGRFAHATTMGTATTPRKPGIASACLPAATDPGSR